MAVSYDGPTLRAIRESMGVPLRRVARQMGMSHGHLSKVERGEHGRPITPAVINAYEKVTGVSLADAAAAIKEQSDTVVGRRNRTWRPGQLTDVRRLAFNAAVGALAIGGQIGEPLRRLVDTTGRAAVPRDPEVPDVVQLEEFGELLTRCDLRFGGAFPSQFAKTVLRWAVAMVEPVSARWSGDERLYGALAAITGRAAWSSVDIGSHEGARALFRQALFCAVRAGDHDLRAHLVADAAAHHSCLGYYDDALDLVRLVEGDERIAQVVRMVLHGVKARAYAGLGEADACLREVARAEQAFMEARPGAEGWLGRMRRPGHLYSATGHALALLARRSESPTDVTEALKRLTAAVDSLDRDTHSRAHALCVARLAAVHAAQGDLEQAARWGLMAVRCAETVHSGRLLRGLDEIRRKVAKHLDAPGIHELVVELDAATGRSWMGSYAPA